MCAGHPKDEGVVHVIFSFYLLPPGEGCECIASSSTDTAGTLLVTASIETGCDRVSEEEEERGELV